MRNAAPLALSVIALCVSVLFATPVGEAGTGIVKQALFAKNAGAVNGIAASRTPKPGRLVPLGANGKFPTSVVPTAVGPAGATGAQGPKGDAGGPGLSGYEQTASKTVAAPAGGTTTTIASCPAGKKALGGGFSSGGQPFAVLKAGVYAGGSDYLVSIKNLGGVSDTLTIWAICATVAG